MPSKAALDAISHKLIALIPQMFSSPKLPTNDLTTALLTKVNTALAPVHGARLLGVPVVKIGLVFLGYVTLVRILRWRRYNATHRLYQAKYEEGRLTPEDAQRVMLLSSGYDMPKLLNVAVSFALFKTYAIPSISKLLYSTRELGSKENVAKRYADTEILISTFVNCPINGFYDLSLKGDENTPAQDSRSMIAVARMNYLHSHYNISNDDFLYTLALFIIEPVVWTRRYGWREFSPLERDSYFIFWHEIGKRMGIVDIPESYEALYDWSRTYEEQYMVPAKSNHLVAKLTTGEMIDAVPEAFGFRNFVERLTFCLLEDRVRIAMMQPEQPRYLHSFVSSVMGLNWMVQRWLCLPRWSPSLPINLAPPETPSGRARPIVYRSKPWYKPESSGLGYIRDKCLVGLGYYLAMPSSKLKSGGYKLEELGPSRLEHAAHEEVFKAAERMQGCPIPRVSTKSKSS
ncbi:hypothetical protein FA15DRAFT_325647 [Coprinopsis marcescibilis]|uniref:ER-bound oxygenase mpaB/mpaB'/Rubber oxygenase catalytic domain-containing protein n=1 Tax=Coprinopsis marcescibilis TaxID=230819 RepID=A0A5C3KZ50_COPMA|nr:hypothetical protein FA15DRAFT_325647 [Coprinopsis marcescibilis]